MEIKIDLPVAELLFCKGCGELLTDEVRSYDDVHVFVCHICEGTTIASKNFPPRLVTQRCSVCNLQLHLAEVDEENLTVECESGHENKLKEDVARAIGLLRD